MHYNYDTTPVAHKEFDFGKFAVRSERKINRIIVVIDLQKDKQGRPIFTGYGKVLNGRGTFSRDYGQNLDTLLVKHLSGNETFMKILGVWQRNHNNHCHPGTARQEAEVERFTKKAFEENPKRIMVSYRQLCDHLKEVGLYVDEGCEYGTDNYYHAISDDDMKTIRELFGMAE